jgi:hypothetical protein
VLLERLRSPGSVRRLRQQTFGQAVSRRCSARDGYGRTGADTGHEPAHCTGAEAYAAMRGRAPEHSAYVRQPVHRDLTRASGAPTSPAGNRIDSSTKKFPNGVGVEGFPTTALKTCTWWALL